MAKFYHITHEKFLRRIDRVGLKSRRNIPIFLIKKRYLNDWMNSMLLDQFESNRRGNLFVVEVSIPNSYADEEEGDVAPQWIYRFNKIPREFIKILPERHPIIKVRNWQVEFPKDKLVIPKRGSALTDDGDYEPKIQQFGNR